MDFKASRVALDARKRKKRNKKGILKTKMGSCMILYMVYWNQQGDLVVQEPTKENDFKLHTFMLSHTALSGCGRYLGLIIVLEGRTTFFAFPVLPALFSSWSQSLRRLRLDDVRFGAVLLGPAAGPGFLPLACALSLGQYDRFRPYEFRIRSYRLTLGSS